jgi:glycosyltransferase 2 family protein
VADSEATAVNDQSVRIVNKPAALDGRFFRRSTLFALVVGIPLSAFLLWLALDDVDLGQVGRYAEDASPPWLVATVVAFLGIFVCFAARWRRLLKNLGLHGVGYLHVLGLVYGGAALSNTFPGRPGEVARGYSAARAGGISPVSAIASVFTDRACDVLVLGLTLVAVLPFVPHPRWLDGIVVGSVVLLALCLAAIGLAWWRVHGAGRSHRGERGTRGRLREGISSFVEGLAAIRTPADVVVILTLTLAGWTLFGLGAWFCARSVDLDLSVGEVVFLTAVVNLGVAIPSSPGFIGTYQWLTVSALSLFAVPRSSAFAFSVMLHALSFVPITVVGYASIGWLAILRRRTQGGVAALAKRPSLESSDASPTKIRGH